MKHWICIYLNSEVSAHVSLTLLICFVESPLKRALVWPNRLHYVYVLQHSLHAALSPIFSMQQSWRLCHFVVGSQCLWKAAEFSVLTWMQMSFWELPLGMCTVISHTNLKSQTFAVTACGDTGGSEGILTNTVLAFCRCTFTGQACHKGLWSQWLVPI